MPKTSFFISSEIYRSTNYIKRHPLAVPRVTITMDLCRALGWLREDNFIESPCATKEELRRFHELAYIEAVAVAESNGHVDENNSIRHNIGINGNLIFNGMYSRSAVACGGGILAAKLLVVNRVQNVYLPGGGQHHAKPNGASGFCFFNEPVLSLLTLLEEGLNKVLYLDLDAHHGDAVQDAFHSDDRVMTVSIHENGRWPMARDGVGKGSVSDRAGGNARNLPVPGGFNDDELAYLINMAVTPLIDSFSPKAVYIQCGADALNDDPQSKLSLSNVAIWRTISIIKRMGLKLLVSGGGGYNPYAVGRCWSVVWGVLNCEKVPYKLPTLAQACLRSIVWDQHRLGRTPPKHWFTTLADKPNTGHIRDEVKLLPKQVL